MLLKVPKTNNHKAKNDPDSFSFNKIYNMSVPPGLTEKCIAKSSMKKKKKKMDFLNKTNPQS